jgi:hypothetical protein
MFKLKSSSLSSMFSGFSSNQKLSPRNDFSTPMRPPSTGMSMKTPMSYPVRERNGSEASSQSSQSSLQHSLQQSSMQSIKKPPQQKEQPPENLLDRSVKITFPKNSGNVISETLLREKVGTFGEIMNVGMKEKLSVVLFSTSTQALVFSVFHNNILGDGYKIKYMGTKVMSDQELQHQLELQLQPKKPPLSHPISQPIAPLSLQPTKPSSVSVPSPSVEVALMGERDRGEREEDRDGSMNESLMARSFMDADYDSVSTLVPPQNYAGNPNPNPNDMKTRGSNPAPHALFPSADKRHSHASQKNFDSDNGYHDRQSRLGGRLSDSETEVRVRVGIH